LRIIWRHAALISEREQNLIPRKIMSLPRNSGVNRRRRVSSWKRDPKFAALDDRFARLLEDEGGSVRNEIFASEHSRGRFHTFSIRLSLFKEEG